jgi:hypothetical protein
MIVPASIEGGHPANQQHNCSPSPIFVAIMGAIHRHHPSARPTPARINWHPELAKQGAAWTVF